MEAYPPRTYGEGDVFVLSNYEWNDQTTTNERIDDSINTLRLEILDGVSTENLNSIKEISDSLNGNTDVMGIINLKALDSTVVHNTGNETVAGNKTFSGVTTMNGNIVLGDTV